MFSQIVEGFKSIVIGPNLDERRVTARVTCTYPAACQSVRGGFLGEILDLSAGGIRVETDHILKKGEKVKIDAPRCFRSQEPATGVVRWTRKSKVGNHAGVEIKGSKTWVGEALKQFGVNPEAPRERRRFVRVSANLSVTVNDQQGELADLSLGGALVRTSTQIPRRAQVRVCIGPLNNLSPVDVVATVREVRPRPGGYTVSLQFARLTEDQQKLVAKYLTSLIRSSRVS